MKEGQTLGQWLNWDFKTNGNLEIKDKNSNQIYCEDSDGFWAKWECDSGGNEIYYESSIGYWIKREHDSKGNEIYFEDSDGVIIDNRIHEVIEHNGRKYKLIP